eukprot:GEZU01022275.1.p1 GENE.GEZU01022275.1~~GEZU01022275.1.p1  ORF type:complete len:105 (-),score=0.81 GEZU01022275.1:200-514(-)
MLRDACWDNSVGRLLLLELQFRIWLHVIQTRSSPSIIKQALRQGLEGNFALPEDMMHIGKIFNFFFVEVEIVCPNAIVLGNPQRLLGDAHGERCAHKNHDVRVR